jgi:hypothetical protein
MQSCKASARPFKGGLLFNHNIYNMNSYYPGLAGLLPVVYILWLDRVLRPGRIHQVSTRRIYKENESSPWKLLSRITTELFLWSKRFSLPFWTGRSRQFRNLIIAPYAWVTMPCECQIFVFLSCGSWLRGAGCDFSLAISFFYHV